MTFCCFERASKRNEVRRIPNNFKKIVSHLEMSKNYILFACRMLIRVRMAKLCKPFFSKSGTCTHWNSFMQHLFAMFHFPTGSTHHWVWIGYLEAFTFHHYYNIFCTTTLHNTDHCCPTKIFLQFKSEESTCISFAEVLEFFFGNWGSFSTVSHCASSRLKFKYLLFIASRSRFR
jgi:hypothetical protein